MCNKSNTKGCNETPKLIHPRKAHGLPADNAQSPHNACGFARPGWLNTTSTTLAATRRTHAPRYASRAQTTPRSSKLQRWGDYQSHLRSTKAQCWVCSFLLSCGLISSSHSKPHLLKHLKRQSSGLVGVNTAVVRLGTRPGLRRVLRSRRYIRKPPSQIHPLNGDCRHRCIARLLHARFFAMQGHDD